MHLLESIPTIFMPESVLESNVREDQEDELGSVGRTLTHLYISVPSQWQNN